MRKESRHFIMTVSNLKTLIFWQWNAEWKCTDLVSYSTKTQTSVSHSTRNTCSVGHRAAGWWTMLLPLPSQLDLTDCTEKICWGTKKWPKTKMESEIKECTPSTTTNGGTSEQPSESLYSLKAKQEKNPKSQITERPIHVNWTLNYYSILSSQGTEKAKKQKATVTLLNNWEGINCTETRFTQDYQFQETGMMWLDDWFTVQIASSVRISWE